MRLDGADPATAATTYRYNDVSGALMHELDSNGNITVTYISDNNGNMIGVQRTVNKVPGTYFYHYNAHGDVVSITDSSGNIVATFTYDAWGTPSEYGSSGQVEAVGAWAGSPGAGLFLLFGGMFFDAATGLYLTRTRVYDPKTGRFLSRDQLMEKEKNGSFKGFPFGKDAIGTNLYAWCGNNPVTRVDPSGKYWVPVYARLPYWDIQWLTISYKVPAVYFTWLFGFIPIPHIYWRTVSYRIPWRFSLRYHTVLLGQKWVKPRNTSFGRLLNSVSQRVRLSMIKRLPPYENVNPTEPSPCGDWAESASTSLFPPSLPFVQAVEFWRWGESPQFAVRTAKNAISVIPYVGGYFLANDSKKCLAQYGYLP